MSDEPNMQAAEYVLGTLSADERRAFEALLAHDTAAQQAVGDWQRRLLPLTNALSDVEPPAHVWEAIETALPVSATTPPSLLLLRRSRNRWRTGAIVMGALAAGFAAVSVDHLLKTPREAAMSPSSIAPAINRRSSFASISRREPFLCGLSQQTSRKATVSNFGISATIWRRSRWVLSTRSIAAFHCRKVRRSRRRILP
jgi:hypothetical protein